MSKVRSVFWYDGMTLEDFAVLAQTFCEQVPGRVGQGSRSGASGFTVLDAR